MCVCVCCITSGNKVDDLLQEKRKPADCDVNTPSKVARRTWVLRVTIPSPPGLPSVPTSREGLGFLTRAQAVEKGSKGLDIEKKDLQALRLGEEESVVDKSGKELVDCFNFTGGRFLEHASESQDKHANSG